jgi:4,5-dihydroxyphthalate decarboxylase
MKALRTALGRYPHTGALLSGAEKSPAFELAFEDLPTANRAFAPMVREGRFDVSEMAIGTFLQALAYRKPLVLLPVTIVARFQEPALICRTDSTIHGPQDLAGRRVGIRSYSQTTALWLRGTLQEAHGVAPDQIDWVTFEGAHVAEVQDPAWVRRAPEGAALLDMLKNGALDAVIMGNDLPDSPEFRPVFPDPTAASEAFFQRHGFVPVNHLVTVRRDIADSQPDIVVGLMRLFRSAFGGVPNLPMGRAALAPAIALAIRYATAQGLLPRALSPREIWTGLPEDPVFE